MIDISSYSVIIQVKVILKRTVVSDWRFDNPSRSHLQSQVSNVNVKSGPWKLLVHLTVIVLAERLV